MADDRHPPDQQTPHPHLDWSATVDEAVDRLVAMLSEQNKQAIRNADSISLFHFSLGMWIRNNFGLWGGNEALLRSCVQWRRGSGNATGTASDDPDIPPLLIHPDDASTIILEALKERLE